MCIRDRDNVRPQAFANLYAEKAENWANTVFPVSYTHLYFRKQGIDYREIYPDSADLKNYETRAIEKENNEEPIKQRLALMHRIFCDAISRNLGIAYDPELPLFRGQIFTGDVAVANGYIDQFGKMCIRDSP